MIALKDKRLLQATPQEMDQLFRRVMIKVGMRATNLPTKEETAIIYQHVLKNYGYHTITEIDLAFDMALTEQLDLKPEDITAYENFSSAYVSRILNSYRRWAAQAYTQTVKHSEPQQKIYDIDIRGLIEKDYQIYLKSGDVKYELFPEGYFEQVVKEGWMNPKAYESEIQETRKEYCAEVQQEIVQLTNDEDFQHMIPGLYEKLKEYREGKREAEIVLRSKQKLVLILFQRAEEMKYKNLYVKTHD